MSVKDPYEFKHPKGYIYEELYMKRVKDLINKKQSDIVTNDEDNNYPLICLIKELITGTLTEFPICFKASV